MSDIIKSLTGQIEKGSRTSNNYNNFENKPQINSITLEGNKSSEQLGINSTTVKFNDGESFQEKYNNGELRGEKGDTGLQGPKGEKGDTGEPGKGIPTGGTIGQILAKKSNSDYDTEWKDAPSGGGGVEEKVVEHETNDTTFELPSNEYHKWDTVAELTLTLKTPTNTNIVNEYHFCFNSGDTPTKLSIPQEIQTDIVVEANTHYECSIIDNFMVFNDWGIGNA